MKNHLLYDIVFGIEGNSITHQLYGWHVPEAGYTWADGRSSALITPQARLHSGLAIEIHCGSLTVPGREPQSLLVEVNGVSAGRAIPVVAGSYAWTFPAPSWEDKAIVINFHHPRAARPAEMGASADQRLLSIAVRRVRVLSIDEPLRGLQPPVYDCRPDDAQVAAERLTGMPPDKLSMEFESLGDNCELGLVQRRLGAEPLGLLRFSTAFLPQVLRGVDTDFHALGERLQVAMEGVEREWMARELGYDLRWHTFLLGEQTTHDEVFARETKKTSFLRQKLIRDIASSEKIFVVKSRDNQAEMEEIMALHLALNRRNANWLLWVTPSDDNHPPGFVEEVAPRLMHGRIDRFSRHNVSDDESMSVWVSLMANALTCAKALR